jgi:hypothetical protein
MDEPPTNILNAQPSNMYTNPPLKVDNIPKNIQLPVIPDSGLHFPTSGPNPNPNHLEDPNAALNLHPNPYMMLHPRPHTHTNTSPDADTDALPPCVHSHCDTLSESPPSACCEDIGCTLGGPRHLHLRCKSLDIERSGMSGGEGGGGHTQFCARDTY